MPGGGCSRWFGDPQTDRRYAISVDGDRLWLGPFDGAWEHEVRLDGRSWVGGAEGLAGDRLLLESPGGVTLVDAMTATRLGPPLFHLDEEPVATLDDEARLLALATPSDAPSDRAGTVMVVDASDGSERSARPSPAR